MKRIWVAITLGGLDLLLALTVHLRVWQTVDWTSVITLQAALPRALDVPFSVLSLIGSAEVTGLILLAIILVARTTKRVPLILAFGAAMIIEFIGKTILYQPPPPSYLLRHVSLIPIPSTEFSSDFSFPSGHALRTMFVAIVLIEMIASSQLRDTAKAWLSALLLTLTVVMLVSRVYLAEHWLTDVIGGAMLGAALALVARSGEINLPIPFLRETL